jgi:uroporphyrinogen decarboxylase
VRDATGQVLSRRAAGAYYFDPVGTPLAHVRSVAELDRFDAIFERWDYAAVYDEPLADLAARAQARYRGTDRAVVANWQLHYMQAGMFMRGYEQFLVDLMVDQPLARGILERLHAAYLKRIDTFFGAFGDAFDIVFLCDDLGTQLSGLLSPDLYRNMLYPYFAEVVGRIKARGKKVIMHSCGAVAEFVPFFIEMGVDALNPVQVSANGMNPRDLVRQFGNDIAFWGGGCNTQGALNAGDTDTVRRDVRQRLDEFGANAHLVFTQVHNVQYDVPPENVLAMLDEFRKRRA